MIAQQSLLGLFERQMADGVRAMDLKDLTAGYALNPFRKYLGPCVKHCGDIGGDGERPVVRLYWCHFCGKIGCQEWLFKHSD
jgi:hypothetical protein